MAKSKSASKKENLRGSPEAIAKRRAARALNSIFDAGPALDASLDGRTLKRKQRMLHELQAGKGGEPIKAHEVLSHATELFALGETLASLRKLKPRLPPTPALNEATWSTIRETQASYGFHPHAWKLLGIDIGETGATGSASADTASAETVKAAGTPARSKKTAAKKKA